MSGGKLVVSWGVIGKFIFALLGVVPAIILLMNYLDSRSPQITVRNELVIPIKVYAGNDYMGVVSERSGRTFQFYSDKIFPVQIRWEGIRAKTQSGDLIGDLVTGSIDYVDNHKTVTINNMAGMNDYFMPILSNNTKMTCKVFINDGLPSEKYVGLLLAGKQRVNFGYQKWLGNSNVTLDCDDGLHWWGDRLGKKGPSLKVQSPNGETSLTLTP